MKKLYSVLAVAALATLGASAQKSAQVGTVTKADNIATSKVAVMRQASALKAPAKAAASIEDVAGTYVWSATSLLNAAFASRDVEVSVVNAATGELSISGLVPNMTGATVTTKVIPAKYDATTGKVSINNKIAIGSDADGAIILYFKEADSEGNILDGASSAATAEAEFTTDANGSKFITFPNTNIWALGDPDNETAGWYYLTYKNAFANEVELPDTRTWTNVGKATFQDGWTLPLFGVDITDPDYHFEVALEKCNEQENVYRLVDPYHTDGYVLESYNTCTTPGYIEFDMTDPEHVSFAIVESGFGYSPAGVEKMYCYNHMGLVSEVNAGYELTTEQIVEFMESKGWPFASVKDNVLTLPSTFVSEAEGYDNDAMFGIQNNKLLGTTWKDNTTGAVAFMEVKIFLPANLGGISDVNVDNANAPVEYYNLQGVRISEPAAGQVVIRRQGTDVQKLFVK